jgi:hypothetical protein
VIDLKNDCCVAMPLDPTAPSHLPFTGSRLRAFNGKLGNSLGMLIWLGDHLVAVLQFHNFTRIHSFAPFVDPQLALNNVVALAASCDPHSLMSSPAKLAPQLLSYATTGCDSSRQKTPVLTGSKTPSLDSTPQSGTKAHGRHCTLDQEQLLSSG